MFHKYYVLNQLQVFMRYKKLPNKGNNKITELQTILQRESQTSKVYKQTKSVNNHPFKIA
jgi:hypothetical protein